MLWVWDGKGLFSLVSVIYVRVFDMMNRGYGN